MLDCMYSVRVLESRPLSFRKHSENDVRPPRSRRRRRTLYDLSRLRAVALSGYFRLRYRTFRGPEVDLLNVDSSRTRSNKGCAPCAYHPSRTCLWMCVCTCVHMASFPLHMHVEKSCCRLTLPGLRAVRAHDRKAVHLMHLSPHAGYRRMSSTDIYALKSSSINSTVDETMTAAPVMPANTLAARVSPQAFVAATNNAWSNGTRAVIAALLQLRYLPRS